MPDKKQITIIGGGVAGMEAAGQLARADYIVTLLEKEVKTGGHVKDWYHLFPDRRDSREVINYLEQQVEHKNINLRTGITVENLKKIMIHF